MLPPKFSFMSKVILLHATNAFMMQEEKREKLKGQEDM